MRLLNVNYIQLIRAGPPSDVGSITIPDFLKNYYEHPSKYAQEVNEMSMLKQNNGAFKDDPKRTKSEKKKIIGLSPVIMVDSSEVKTAYRKEKGVEELVYGFIGEPGFIRGNRHDFVVGANAASLYLGIGVEELHQLKKSGQLGFYSRENDIQEKLNRGWKIGLEAFLLQELNKIRRKR